MKEHLFASGKGQITLPAADVAAWAAADEFKPGECAAVQSALRKKAGATRSKRRG